MTNPDKVIDQIDILLDEYLANPNADTFDAVAKEALFVLTQPIITADGQVIDIRRPEEK